MEVNSIERGIVIDHIRAGLGLKILEYLQIQSDVSGGTTALIMNATSGKRGRKDIIKIENMVDVDLTALGLIDHSATVNIIENGKISRKINLSLPKSVVNVLHCKNPRCVTQIEPGIDHRFNLVDEEKELYSCEYCNEIVKAHE
jgi:aspartate carbamoyltransferase regulatory subunit